MKQGIREFFLAAVLAALLAGTCAAQEAYHAAYLYGFPDGSIRPEQPLTRAELAQSLCRLLPEQTEAAQDVVEAFCDVESGFWAEAAIEKMARLGLMRGAPDGRFLPEQGVTGGELAIILERLRQSEEADLCAAPLAAGWVQQEISFAAGNGWVMGLHGDAFAKEQALTRGEFAQIMNRILGRTPEALSALLVGMPLFSDNLDTTAPFFLAIQEAAVDHTAQCADEGERWLALG